MYICTHIAVEHVHICMQFIALGTYDGTIKLLDHTGTFLKDRNYAVVRKFLQFCVHVPVHALYTGTCFIYRRSENFRLKKF